MTMGARSFEIRKSSEQLAKTALTFVAAVGGFAVIFAFLAEDSDSYFPFGNRPIFVAIAAICIPVFAWGVFLIRRKARYAVSVDDEGIWMTHAGREDGLVLWEQVRGVRHRPLLRRMELIDDDHRVLVRVNRYLYERGLLEEIIAERAHRMRAWDRVGSPYGEGKGPLGAQRVYHSRPWRYIGFAIRFVVLMAIVVAAWVLISEWVAAAIFLAGEFWSATRNRTVTRLKITPERLVIDMLYKQVRLRRSDIKSIQVREIYDGILLIVPIDLLFMEFLGYSGPAVVIQRSDGEWDIQLYGMGTPVEDLARRLNHWLADEDAPAAATVPAGSPELT